MIDPEKQKTPPTQSITSFNHLPIYPYLQNSLTSMGIIIPTPIQQHTLLPGLQGRDIVGAAITGSGKTLCFAIPILQSLASDPYGIHSLILTPTRELAFQIGDQFKALGSKISIRVQIVVGGLDMFGQTTGLLQLPHIVIATPGRLLHILKENSCPGLNFKRIKFLILDEADMLLSEYFEESLQEIFNVLPKKKTNHAVFGHNGENRCVVCESKQTGLS